MQKSRSIIVIALLLLSLIGFFSCKSDKPVKASSTGKADEVIVVIEDNLWKTTIGDSIKSFFNSNRTGLPQPEPLFKIIQLKFDEFSRFFETHRNILAVAIDSSLTEGKYETAYNVWAMPQRVVKITAPNIENLKELFETHKRDIFNIYENEEIKRLQAFYSRTQNPAAVKLIKEKFHLKVKVPRDYYVAVNKPGFLWLRNEADIISQGIIIYSYPYTDTVAFNLNKIISVRNQFTHLYIPGPSDSSYMVVAGSVIPPVKRNLDIKKALVVETRGLWEVRRDFMGGPFINYTFVDKKNNMVITLDGYVYAPNKDKADLLRQVQSVLLTFEFEEAQPD